MVRTTIRVAVQILGAFGLVLLLGIPLVAWSLSKGPVRLDFLTPYIENALNDDDAPFRVELGGTVLTWAGFDRALDIRVVDAEVRARGGGRVATIPELAVTFSAARLLAGEVAPHSVDLVGPTILLRRDEDGAVRVGFVGTDDPPAAGGGLPSLSDLVNIAAGDAAAGASGSGPDVLRYLRMEQAAVVLDDRIAARVWRFEGVSGAVFREGGGLGVELSAALAEAGPDMTIDAVGHYRARTAVLDLGLSFAGFRPAAVAEVTPGLGALAGIDVPVEGTVTVSLNFGDASGEIAVGPALLVASSPGGRIAVPDQRAPVAVGPVTLQATLYEDMNRLAVTEGDLTLPDEEGGGRIRFSVTAEGLVWGAPAISVVVDPRGVALAGPLARVRDRLPEDHRAWAETVAKEAVFDRGRLFVRLAGPDWDTLTLHRAVASDIEIPLAPGGARVAAQVAWFPPLDGGPARLEAEAEVKALAAGDLGRYWPPVKASVRAWMVANLTGGRYDAARVEAVLEGPSHDQLGLRSLSGSARASGMAVHYLRPLPAVTDVAATATFTAERVQIATRGGSLGNLRAGAGRIVFRDLGTAAVETMDLTLPIEGPVAEAIALIDKEPLAFTKAVSVSPEGVGGHARVDLSVTLPLLDELTLDQVDASAKARATGVLLPDVLLGQDLTEGEVTLAVDKVAMDVAGSARLGGVPVELTWRETFGEAEVRARYTVTGTVGNGERQVFGLDVPPFVPPFLDGPVGASIVYTRDRAGRGALGARLDLAAAAMSLPGVRWRKPAGAPGSAQVAARIGDRGVIDVPSFTIEAGDDLRLQGAADLTDEGRFDAVTFSTIKFGRTQGKGTIRAGADGGFEVSVDGAVFDATPLLADEEVAPGEPATPGPPLSIAARFDKVWLGEQTALADVSATLRRGTDARWSDVSISAVSIPDGGPLTVAISPRQDGLRDLSLAAGDGGSLLKALGVVDRIRGGRLRVTGVLDGSDHIEGVAAMDSYSVRDAPLLAQVLSVAGLTGVFDLLQGEGITFDRLTAPFTFADGLLTLTDARTAGTSIGLTAEGQVDLRSDVIAMKGTIVPAYAVNSLLGNIPLIGGLFSAEKGGGLFAFTYGIQGPVAQPTVTVNPLSALAPGFLRDLFDVFDGAGGGVTARPPGQ